MWIRSVLKENAKKNLRSKYWTAFGVTILVGIISGAFSGIVSNITQSFNPISIIYSTQTLEDMISYMLGFLRIITAGIIVSTLLGFLFSIFVTSILMVGQNRWFSRNRESMATPTIGIAFSLFKSGSYLKAVGSMLWMNLFLFLWSIPAAISCVLGYYYLAVNYFQNLLLLAGSGTQNRQELAAIAQKLIEIFGIFVLIMLAAGLLYIPVIIKTYSYKMTPWILADNPKIGFHRALKLSIDLTRGHKWQIFVLDLSFVGWYILGFLACCVGILFVNPYYYAAQAELYATLRQDGIALNLCTMEELGFVAVMQPDALPQPPSETD